MLVRGLERVRGVPGTWGREGAREVEEIPSRPGDSLFLIASVDTGREKFDKSASTRLDGARIEGGDRRGIREPPDRALLEDGKTEFEEDRDRKSVV